MLYTYKGILFEKDPLGYTGSQSVLPLGTLLRYNIFTDDKCTKYIAHQLHCKLINTLHINYNFHRSQTYERS